MITRAGQALVHLCTSNPIILKDKLECSKGTFFELGGRQTQMNVVTADTLRDSKAHPESYRNLLVRISGYNAYFVTLYRDMQTELVERAEYAI